MIKVDKVEIVAWSPDSKRHRNHQIIIRARLRQGKLKRWATVSLEVGAVMSSATCDDFWLGEVSIGVDVQKQVAEDGGTVIIPCRMLCVPIEGKGWSQVNVWGSGICIEKKHQLLDGSHDDALPAFKHATVLEGTVCFHWEQAVKKAQRKAKEKAS